ncbi:MAG: fimbrillin family protein [Bacteroidales bacterium]|nr:fimbrillin family protein [Bacteroidales bacterium]
MKLKNILHTAMALTAALFAGGCMDRDALERQGSEISFSAGTVRLEEGTGTKAKATLDTRTEFDADDVIRVWGWHNAEGGKVFDGQEVTLVDKAQDIWNYTPKKKWRWSGGNDWYDFLAVPATVPGSDVTVQDPTSASTFSLSVHYNTLADPPYDLLMAGTRRKVTDPDASSKVPLNFQHMLSAVKVVFYRAQGGQRFVITSFGFTGLQTEGDVTGYWDEYGKSFSSRVNNAVRAGGEHYGEIRITPWLEPDKFVDIYDPGFYDLMLPQSLDGDTVPELTIALRDDTTDNHQYTPDPIPLKDIKIKGTDTPITRWEPGRKYLYEVQILLNGGVLVNVITTEWDDVPAQTPGLMI